MSGDHASAWRRSTDSSHACLRPLVMFRLGTRADDCHSSAIIFVLTWMQMWRLKSWFQQERQATFRRFVFRLGARGMKARQLVPLHRGYNGLSEVGTG